MSKETMNWLNTMTLIGHTDKRGKAWHYKAAEQGDESNHYGGAIPVEDVRRRLFSWEVVSGTVSSTGMNAGGVFTIEDPTRQTMLRPPGALGVDDEGAILGVFKKGYQGHQYDPWLVGTIADILDGDLSIGSAGLLKQGAQAFVQVEVPDNVTTPEGVVFRPNLLATTSFDGSLATCFKRTVTNVVCDNTMAAGLAEKGQTYKVKHTKYSHAKLSDAREALAIVHTIADDFAAEVAALTSVKVSNGDWAKFLDEIAPTVDEHGEPKKGRGYTLATNLRDDMNRLWRHDERVAPWSGTAYGVVQAVNTHAHHIQTVRGSGRAERNMNMAVSGAFDKLDADTRSTILSIAG